LRRYGDDATEVATTRQLVKAFADKHGRRPRILVAKMGQDGHDPSTHQQSHGVHFTEPSRL
jgi:methylmalonyl-CoA mutase cobalamin-binding subunit